jgi:hypothetical protein
LRKQTIIKISDKNLNKSRGFIWYPSLNLSVQGYDANNTVTEIVRLCIKNKINLTLTSKLNNPSESLVNILIHKGVLTVQS